MSGSYESYPLQKLLAELYEKARSNPMIPQRLPLRRGTRVDMVINVHGALLVQISRVKVYPSATEWNTVMKNMPFEATNADQKEQFQGNDGRWYIRARWSEHGSRPAVIVC